MHHQLVEEWQAVLRRTGSKYDAGQVVLANAKLGVVAIEAVKPLKYGRPLDILKCLAALDIRPDTPVKNLTESYLKKAFHETAPKAHADTGGSDEAFKKLMAQYDALLKWVESPNAAGGRRGLPGCWLYHGKKKKWLPPL